MFTCQAVGVPVRTVSWDLGRDWMWVMFAVNVCGDGSWDWRW